MSEIERDKALELMSPEELGDPWAFQKMIAQTVSPIDILLDERRQAQEAARRARALLHREPPQ